MSTATTKLQVSDRIRQMRQLARQVSRMTEDERRELAERCHPTTIEGHPLSLHNACMIYYQNHSATIVGGYRQWLAAGRHVRKGEHGLGIWCPMVRKAKDGDADQTEEIRFRIVTVFDVSQTDEND